MLYEMTVSELVMDPQTNTPIVVLREKDGERTLPIWIGIMEATAIAMQMEDIQFPRPMTHDLMKNILEHLSAEVTRIEVHDLRDNTYFAWICLNVNGKETQVDARPSDAIALALRTGSPIFVRDRVFRKSAKSQPSEHPPVVNADDRDRLAKLLEDMDPEEFGKYKM
ncbi:MAG: bifunctional nuclease family protein [Deltaproteobacteria bacterium]|nr:bifunctional nuclease family protein [Deltaproteobacteria bacterium]MBW2068751.1 bifunctional nuclease family protein [Deltaproteobacteria bacterium]